MVGWLSYGGQRAEDESDHETGQKTQQQRLLSLGDQPGKGEGMERQIAVDLATAQAQRAELTGRLDSLERMLAGQGRP